MKKFALCFILSILLSSLTACTPPQDIHTPATEINWETTANIPTTTIQENALIEQLPLYAIALPIVTETESATNNQLLFKHTYQDISLVVPEAEVANKVILDFLNKTDLHSEADTLKSAAAQDFQNNPSVFSPYWVQNIYNPMRIDRSVLSLYGSYATYSGGAHGAFSFKSINYDLVTGEALKLDDIFSEQASHEEIYNLIIKSLDEQKESEQLFDGFEKIVLNLIGNNLFQSNDWFFSNDGLCFFFSPYEIGPFASADVVATIPYESLIGILDDAYFPAERENINGTVRAEEFNETKLSQFTQLSEIVIKENSKKILLYTDKIVYDVTIKIGSWSADGTTFTPENTVFASHTLTPGDAIVLENELNEKLPTMQLSYNVNGKQTQHYISIGENNIITLTEK